MKEKEQKITIQQINTVAVPEEYVEPSITLGLGDDQRMYYWSTERGVWCLDILEDDEE